jgi:hypothetical protein
MGVKERGLRELSDVVAMWGAEELREGRAT